MNKLKFQWIFYLIVVVIISTIAIQVYWNYNNYLSNKQQLINDVQVSLDNAVDNYYAQIAAHKTMAFAFEIDSNDIDIQGKKTTTELIKHIDSLSKTFSPIDSLRIEILEDFTNVNSNDPITIKSSDKAWHTNKMIVKSTENAVLDSITNSDFKMLTSKVIYAMTNDSLNLESIDSLLKSELNRKELLLDYRLLFKSPFDSLQVTSNNITKPYLTTNSKSTYLPKESLLEIQFSNITQTVLKRILLGILISTILVFAVIGCLIYLLNIIRHQKQLAEVKNDLISNLTHEFKTPIATIGVALESIKNFNVINDKEKTKNYISISNDQLQKLNTMVEKLLETASLDSENLELNLELVNLTVLIEKLVYKHQLQTSKNLKFNPENTEIYGKVDAFHFENAINNILDNAVKYGGNNITLNLVENNIAFTIIITDNGNTLTQANKNKIFQKFYRVPKGNTHDVRGFGIGLYYTKKIIEKHGGVIHLDLEKNQTSFKISVPNG